MPFRLRASDCTVSSCCLKGDACGTLTSWQAQGQETHPIVNAESSLLSLCVCTCTNCWFPVCLMYWPCAFAFVHLILLQTEPHQALADLQSHVGRDQSHLSRWTVSRRNIPHYQGRRCRFLEKVFWRKVSFLLILRCMCQIRSDLSSCRYSSNQLKLFVMEECLFSPPFSSE